MRCKIKANKGRLDGLGVIAAAIKPAGNGHLHNTAGGGGGHFEPFGDVPLLLVASRCCTWPAQHVWPAYSTVSSHRNNTAETQQYTCERTFKYEWGSTVRPPHFTKLSRASHPVGALLLLKLAREKKEKGCTCQPLLALAHGVAGAPSRETPARASGYSFHKACLRLHSSEVPVV